MRPTENIPVVFERGVFRPESPIELPDRSRFLMTLRELPFDESDAQAARRELADLRSRGVVRLNGWTFDRDDLYERG